MYPNIKVHFWDSKDQTFSGMMNFVDKMAFSKYIASNGHVSISLNVPATYENKKLTDELRKKQQEFYEKYNYDEENKVYVILS